VHTGLPGIARANKATVLQFQRLFAHVPDVSLLVLRVPIERALHRHSVLGDGVAYDGAANPEYALDLTRHDHVVGLRDPIADATKVKAGAGLERKTAVVDVGHEVRRIDRRRVRPSEDPARRPRRR